MKAKQGNFTVKFIKAENLIRPRNYRSEQESLQILSWLCQEIYKEGGHPNHLDPEQITKSGKAILDLKASYNNTWMRDIIIYALSVLPCRTEKKDLPSVKDSINAMRKIVENWGSKSKKFSIPDLPRKDGYSEYLGLETMEKIREMTLTLAINPYHQQGRRIHKVNYGLTKEGKAYISLTIKYSRELIKWECNGTRSVWFLRNTKAEEAADFLEEFNPKENESAEATFARVTNHILAHTTNGPVPHDWNLANTYWGEQQKFIEREETYERLQRDYHINTLTEARNVDTDTKAKFEDPDSPGFVTKEISSMLADFFHDKECSETELICLADGLKKMRRIRRVRQAFEALLNPKNNKDCKKLYREAKALAKEENLEVYAEIAANAHQQEPLPLSKIVQKENGIFLPKRTRRATRPVQKVTRFIIKDSKVSSRDQE